MFTRGSFMHQKCSNYALTNLFFGLCKSMWIIEFLVTLPSPHPEAPARPSTPKCCKPGSVPELLILLLFSHLDSHVSLKEFGGASYFLLALCSWLLLRFLNNPISSNFHKYLQCPQVSTSPWKSWLKFLWNMWTLMEITKVCRTFGIRGLQVGTYG